MSTEPSSNNRLYVRWPDDSCEGDGEVGGLVGRNTGTVTKSYATGAVNANAKVSNIYGADAAIPPAPNSDVGGLVGVNDGGTISFSYATGLVTVGEIVAEHDNRNGFTRGWVEGGRHAGGLVGWNINAGSIVSSFSTGDVREASEADDRVGDTVVFGAFGGVAGRNSGGATIEASYYTGAVRGGGGASAGWWATTPAATSPIPMSAGRQSMAGGWWATTATDTSLRAKLTPARSLRAIGTRTSPIEPRS